LFASQTSSIISVGVLLMQVLCGRLLAIEYIDLAEQSLQALEKLSHEHPQVRRDFTMTFLFHVDVCSNKDLPSLFCVAWPSLKRQKTSPAKACTQPMCISGVDWCTLRS